MIKKKKKKKDKSYRYINKFFFFVLKDYKIFLFNITGGNMSYFIGLYIINMPMVSEDVNIV